jgi:hypothetical protein
MEVFCFGVWSMIRENGCAFFPIVSRETLDAEPRDAETEGCPEPRQGRGNSGYTDRSKAAEVGLRVEERFMCHLSATDG